MRWRRKRKRTEKHISEQSMCRGQRSCRRRWTWQQRLEKNLFIEIYLLIFPFFQEVSILFELLGLSAKESLQCNAGGLLQRIAHLKVAVSALMESSKENVDAVTINGDLEDVEIVHRKPNGNGVHMMDLTAVEALEVKIDKKIHSNNE